ncbi:hypothetical protein SFRURICE_007952 [Spodoptera frugiperda]|nr:hypothetical protein SFRURICE_007952 [Spodoptera frugiperda]
MIIYDTAEYVGVCALQTLYPHPLLHRKRTSSVPQCAVDLRAERHVSLDLLIQPHHPCWLFEGLFADCLQRFGVYVLSESSCGVPLGPQQQSAHTITLPEQFAVWSIGHSTRRNIIEDGGAPHLPQVLKSPAASLN